MNKNKYINDLAEKIIYHKALYYQGRAEISDEQFDQLEDELKQLMPNHPVLGLIGTAVKSEKKVKHEKKMLSLTKTYLMKDLTNWIDTQEVLATYKVDGVSCSLIFEDGQLVLAKTRGDGQYGEDITSKVLWIKDIPKTLLNKDRIEIRGEIYCNEIQFFHLAEEMIKLELDRPQSQRNIVAGLIGRKDHVELCRYLSFFAFECLPDQEFKTDWEMFENMQKYGFEVPNVSLITSIIEVDQFIEDTKKFMNEGSFLIDGAVFSYNKKEVQNSMGYTAHHPKYKMAFKFQGETKKTKLLEIIWHVSRNGTLTPVGNVEPVELSGATISRVSLHNYGLVKEFNLKEGDLIEIVRSGEVIPKFLSVISSSANKLKIPELCSSCGEKVSVDEIRLICTNPNCPGKLKEGILDFIQKIGVDDLSSKRLDELIKNKMVKTIPDLYKLTIEDFLTLDKVKEKLANKLFNSIQKTKTINLKKFMGALGISGGGYNKCEKIIDSGFNTISKIMDLKEDQLIEIDSFAEKSAVEFIKSLKSKLSLVNELIDVGFIIKDEKLIERKSNSPFSNKKICITGALSQKRSIIEDQIKEEGGKVIGSVSKNTDYLLTNETDSSSSKFKKAKELKIPIITEADFFQMIKSS